MQSHGDVCVVSNKTRCLSSTLENHYLTFLDTLMMNNNKSNRRPNGRAANNNNRKIRLPKSITANAPFSIGRNKQLVSIPSHTDGLTVRRAVRFNMGSTGTGNPTITYADVFNRFLAELQITLRPDGRLSFSPEWVSSYLLSDTHNSLKVRLFDEPRSNATAGAFVNSPFYESVDSSTTSGACSIKAIVPKAATYSVSVDDPVNLKALPFIGYGTLQPGQLVVDVGGTWTIKGVLGTTF